ncbi:tetratricopeptide repeat protein, partial [bacterium]|nr:tetratricopeptide repeat protein [bacterium]
MFGRSISLLLGLLLCVIGYAQQTQKYTADISLFEHGKMLYMKQQYVPAIQDFRTFLAQEPTANMAYEANAYLELSRLHLGKRNADRNLVSLIKDNPEHKLNKEIEYELGIYYFQEEKYKRALRYLEEINERDLPKDEREEFIFKKGYSYFIDEEYLLAKAEFSKLLNSSSKYGIQANYYYGYQCYILKDYACALNTFEKIGDKGPKTMNLYVAQIYYEREEYDKAWEIVKDIQIESKENEILLLKGKIQYQLGNYSIALSLFESYKGSIDQLSDDENFQFAHAYFLGEQYEKSTPFFLKIANLENEIGQAANYHLGVSDLNSNEKERALNAFAEAKRKDFDSKITEVSFFNYAKLAAELKQNNIAISALRDFMQVYPHSEYKNEAENIMASIYLSTKNYKAAIAMIESIDRLDEGTKSAYQVLTYHRGEELYLNSQLDESAIYFRKSLKYIKDRKLEAHAHFWLGEIAFQKEDYRTSQSEHFAFINNSESSKSEHRNYAYYTIGYSYLKSKDYTKASQYFKKYKSLTNYNAANKKVYIDNQLRLADCYYLNRQYSLAIDAYADVLKHDYLKNGHSDYALYQQGMLYGLVGKTDEKINTLRKVQKDFSSSTYTDDALFQIGSEYLEMAKYSLAENMFQLIISQHDYSKYLAESYMRMGLIYYNQEKDNEAMTYYKSVVERFPNTTHSNEALIYIKEIYVRQGKTDDWLAYAKQNGSTISRPDLDSTLFESAWIQYKSKGCDGAMVRFKNYLQEFGNDGLFSIPVNYYKAECDYDAGRIEDALQHYEYVASARTNEFTERSVIILASTYYSQKNYGKSLDYYAQLQSLASNSANLHLSKMGQMRCYYQLGENEKSKSKAIEIISESNVPKADMVEANMTLGRIQLNDDNLRSARFHFDYVINNSRNQNTAEALYSRAFILFEQNDLDSAREDIYKLNDDFSAYEFWVVKGFILLSDIYVKQEDYFQAKATLRSILD